jgi:aquaporin Z
LRKYTAEFIGTLVLVFGGVGSAVLAGPRIRNLGIALAFGLSLLVMVYAIGPISGCHVNPAVTLGLALAKKMDRRHVTGYVAAQILGAILGAGLVLLIARGGAQGYHPSVGGLAANGYGPHSPGGYDPGAAFLAEVVLTALLVLTVLLTTDVRAPAGFAGIAIGLVLALIHLVGIPVTNTSVNPARSIGPALFVGGWALEQLWLFLVAPLLGGALAAAVYLTVQSAEPPLKAREAERALPLDELQRRAEALREQRQPL